MKKTWYALLALTLCFLLVMSAGTAFADQAQFRIRITENGASLRTAPSTDAYKIASIHAGDEVDVYRTQNGWYYVCYWGQWGYVHPGNTMRIGPASSSDSDYQVTRIRTNEEGVSLRSSPMVTSYNKIDGVHQYTYLDVYSTVNGFYQVCYKGQWGYVSADPYLVTVIEYEGDPPDGTPSGTVLFRVRTNSQGASLRSDPWKDYNNKISGIGQYTYLDVYAVENGWYYVYYNGQWGYVNASPSIVTVVP